MKKRLIWFIVIVACLGLAAIVVIIPTLRSWVRETFSGLYTWFHNNLGDLYYAFRHGTRRFVLISGVGIVVSALLSFGLLYVPAVNDKTMAPIAVDQKPVITTKNGRPAIMVIEESKESKEEN